MYKFLKTGFVSFPLKDKGKDFDVAGTIDIEVKEDDTIKSLLKHSKSEVHYKHLIDWFLRESWKEIDKMDLKYEWIVPIFSSFIKFESSYSMSFDLLKEKRAKKKKESK